MINSEKYILKYAAIVFLLGISPSMAFSKDIEIRIENQQNSALLENNSKEIRILGQIFGQSGIGIGDDYVGTDRDVESDICLGLRLGAGIAWKNYMLALNGEYLWRKLNISETPVVPDPPPSEKESFEYQYLKFQPEFTLKMNLTDELEIGLVTGLGFRTKLNKEKYEDGTDKSISIGCYGQYLGINARIANELFYDCLHNSERTNISFSLGYSRAFKLK